MRTLTISSTLAVVLITFSSLSVSSVAQESASPATASTEKPALPNGAILKPLPSLAQWAVVYAAPNSKAGAEPKPAAGEAAKKPRTIVITKNGTTQREVETDAAGQSWVCWKIDGHEISYAPNGQYAVSDPGLRPEFAEFSWIAPKNYTSTAKIGGQDCYIFQDTITRPDFLNPVKVTAAIDMKTQLPVYLVVGTSPRTYRFGAPAAPLAVPPEIAAIVAGRPKVTQSAARQ